MATVTAGSLGKITYTVTSSNTATTVKLSSITIAGESSYVVFLSNKSAQPTSGDTWLVVAKPGSASPVSVNKSTSAVNWYVHLLVGSTDPTKTSGTTHGSTSFTVPALASYAVKYAANGGSPTPNPQTKYYGRSLTLATAISHANTTPTSYKVTYNYNGSGQTATSATANVTRKWTFSRWKASDNKLYEAGKSYTVNAATTMTAQWTTSDTTAQLTLPTPNARTGYTFAGWYTAATGGSSKGGAGAKFTPTAVTTLYAHWTGNSYAVNYDANGGTDAPSAQTRTYGTALKLSTTKPTRIGHTFLGWATTSSASSVQYAPGASYNPSTAAATKLYAVWKSNYVAPKITSLTAIRCDSTGTADDEGGYAKVTAVWSTMQNIDQNKTANYGTVTGKTRASDASSDVAFAFSSGAGGSGAYSGTAVAIVPNMSTEKSYRVTVTVADVQGGKSISRTTTLTASFFTMDFAEGGRGIGILEAAPATGVTIGGNTTLHGDFNMEGNFMNFNTNNYDRDAAANESGQYGINVQFCDKDGERAGTIRVDRDTGGIMRMKIGAFTENASNQEVYNWLQFGINRDGTKYYSVSDVPKFRIDLSLMGAKSDGSYWGIMKPDGSDASFIRTTQSGIIPYTSGGSGSCGTSTWPFNSIYGKNIYVKHSSDGTTDTNLANAVTSISRSGTTFTATRANGTTFTFTQQDNNLLSGGTLSGTLTNDKYSFIAKYHGTDDDYNRDGSVPTADRWSTGFYIHDKDGEPTAFLRSVRRATTGRMDTILYAYNEPSGGSTDPVGNSFIVGVERDGTKYYYAADADKFRSDLGITPANIGAAKTSHGNHVPTTQTADNAKFLRNDNTWQTVTPAHIGALALSGGTLTGPLYFKNGTALPNASTTTDFFMLGINSFSNGGDVKYKNVDDAKAWLGVTNLTSKVSNLTAEYSNLSAIYDSLALSSSSKSATTASPVTINANSSAAVTATVDVPSGYTLKCIYKIQSNHTAALHMTSWKYSDGTVTAWFYNVNSSKFTDVTISVSVTFVKLSK